MITSTVNVTPAGIVYLHNRAKRGEADHYGVQMFSFEITPEIAAVSPYLQTGDKVYLLYRKVPRT